MLHYENQKSKVFMKVFNYDKRNYKIIKLVPGYIKFISQ